MKIHRQGKWGAWPICMRNWLSSISNIFGFVYTDDFERELAKIRARYKHDEDCYEFDSEEDYIAFRLTWE